MSLTFVPRNRWAGDIPPNRSVIPRIATPTRTLWLHHGASGQPNRATARAYVRYHVRDLNWWDVGYNHLVIPGEVLVGRGEGRQGGHTVGFNTNGSGICAVGNYDRYQPEEELISTLIQLVRIGHERGWWGREFDGGHRDARGANTACPGRFLYARLEEINRRIRSGDDPVRVLPDGVVTVGDSGPRVGEWQTLLGAFLPNHPDAHAPDERFGPKTLRWSLAALDAVGLSVADRSRPRIGPRSFQAVGDALAAQREPWYGKHVQATVPTLRFYDSPRWTDPTGTFSRGQRFAGGITDLLDVGNGRQYEVWNSRGGGPFYVTASDRFVTLVD